MIRLENLNINLKNNKLLIGNINIFIPSGCIVSIIGKPASGKTKLFNVIGLQENANAGNLYILGKNTNKLDRNEISSLHKEISLVSESNDLIYNLGVKENIKCRQHPTFDAASRSCCLSSRVADVISILRFLSTRNGIVKSQSSSSSH